MANMKSLVLEGHLPQTTSCLLLAIHTESWHYIFRACINKNLTACHATSINVFIKLTSIILEPNLSFYIGVKVWYHRYVVPKSEPAILHLVNPTKSYICHVNVLPKFVICNYVLYP